MTAALSSYTVVFTDSGLGGLSIMADFYNAVKAKSLNIDQLNIVFFNALQESGNGYNSMSGDAQKVDTFNGALETIVRRYQPDQIAIACNTLSSIYPQTPFARKKTNTLEIISIGRSQIKKNLEKFPELPVFVLATPTTLSSKAYMINSDNVFYVSGDNLASLIEFNYKMPELKQKVIEMFAEIKDQLNGNTICSIFFGCTHYAYITNLFREVAAESGIQIKTILDPAGPFNTSLIDFLPERSSSNGKTKIELKIESQAQILAEEIVSVSSMIQDRSAQLTTLLRNYTHLPKTF